MPGNEDKPKVGLDRSSREADKRQTDLRDFDERQEISDVDDDPLYVPLHEIPEGWHYEWKREVVLGFHDKNNMTQNLRRGWVPVSASDHPSLVAPPLPGETEREQVIRSGGLILMKCREADHQARLAANKRRTVELEQANEQKLGASSDDAPAPRLKPFIKTTVERPQFED